MKILVTGGAGFIGSHIVDKLVEHRHEVIIIDNLSTGKIENVNKEAKLYIKDICSQEIFQIFEKENIDIVYHHAAQIDVQQSIKDPIFDGDVNILGTLNLLEACKKYNIKKIIYASSAAVYGHPVYLAIDEKHPINPISYYGISKYTPENYITVYSELYGIDYTILRYANVYGIRQDPKGEGGVISIFMDKMFKNETPIIYGDGSATRDFIYVEDVAYANTKALTKGSKEIINIGTGIATSIGELYDTMREIIGVDIDRKFGQERGGDIRNSFFNINKVKKILSWAPAYSLDDGLRKTIQYYKRIAISGTMKETAVSIE